MSEAVGASDKGGGAEVGKLLALGQPAWQLALRILGNAEGADDAVQQAYLNALRHLRAGAPPQEARTWFFKLVANAARDQLKTEARRKKREAAVQTETSRLFPGPGAEADILPALRGAMEQLDARHRVLLALCYEQGLTQREAAAVLDIPQSTVALHVAEGLEELRKYLGRSGYAAATAALIGGLSHTAPPAPAALTAAIQKLLLEGVAYKGTGAAAVSAAAKGGIAMKIVIGVVAAGVLAGAVAVMNGVGAGPRPAPAALSSPPAANSLPPAGTNPVTGRQDREEVFEFAQKPTVTKQGDPSTGSGQARYVIAFASKGKCDATVAIVSPDGKIVRHLASGVLGKNAPWPFKQDSLSQSVEWDGKDDTGKPAPAGCKVRVGLGLKATLDRMIGDEPRRVGGACLTCDSQGNLYVVGGAGSCAVLDRDGNYVRTAWPPPATMPPERITAARFTKRTDGKQIPLLADNGITMEGPGASYMSSMARHTPIVTPDDKELLLLTSGYQPCLLVRLGTDGGLSSGAFAMPHEKIDGVAIGGIQGATHGSGPGGLQMALSPDGTWMYFGSPDYYNDKGHAVYRRKLAELKTPDGKTPLRAGVPPEVFLGEPSVPGNDDKHFNCVRGVACDKDGNLYVADRGNNRIQVFSPDGKLLRSIVVEGPDMLAVHPKTGSIYVYMWRRQKISQLAKLDKDGKIISAVSLKPFRWDDSLGAAMFCLDASGSEAALWTHSGEGLVKYADRGDKFEKVKDVGAEVGTLWKGWRWCPPTHKGYIVVDRNREEIYVSQGQGCMAEPQLRIDGRTGKLIERIDAGFEELHPGPDGLIYARVESAGKRIVRFNPADKKCVPFANGVDFTFLGQKTTAIPVPAMGGNGTFQYGFCVAPNGDMYLVLAEADPAIHPELVKVGQGANIKPAKGPLVHIDFLQVYAPDGTRKDISAIPGLIFCSGVRVARNGNVVLAVGMKPKVQKEPNGIVAGMPFFNAWGTLVCFDSAFGKFPIGRFHGTFETPKTANPTHEGHRYNMTVEPMRWDYGGMSPIIPASGCCACFNSRFDLDGFDRSWVPAAHTYSVNVLDANGNLIIRIGSYGNVDSRGKDSPVADPKTGLLRPKKADDPADLKPPKELSEGIGFGCARFVAVSDEALYAHDTGNQRIARCAIGYAAEETVPLP